MKNRCNESVIMQMSTTADPLSSSDNKLHHLDNKNLSNFMEENATSSNHVSAIIVIASLVFLVSIVILQLLLIFYLKQKNTALEAKLNNMIPMSTVAIPQSTPLHLEGEEEINEFYGIPSEKEKTADVHYYDIEYDKT